MKWITTLVVLGAAMMTACASQPQATSPATASGNKSVPATASAAVQKDKSATPRGYRRAVVNGQELFCRKDAVTGSRAERPEICLTREQLDAEQESSQQFIQRVQQSGTINDRPCMGGTTPC